MTLQRILVWQAHFAMLAGAVLVLGGCLPARSAADRTLDMTYDSVMDMVRPDNHPGMIVHHNLHVVVSNQAVAEDRERSSRTLFDTDATRQQTGQESGDYVSWRYDGPDRLIRTERDLQSTRTMIVTLSQGSCNLDVTDALKPGFTEYKFSRIGHRDMAYFSSYREVSTTCTIR